MRGISKIKTFLLVGSSPKKRVCVFRCLGSSHLWQLCILHHRLLHQNKPNVTTTVTSPNSPTNVQPSRQQHQLFEQSLEVRASEFVPWNVTMTTCSWAMYRPAHCSSMFEKWKKINPGKCITWWREYKDLFECRYRYTAWTCWLTTPVVRGCSKWSSREFQHAVSGCWTA